MKVISIERIEDGFAGFIDDGSRYAPFTVLKGEPVEREQGWPKTNFIDFETFVSIYVKFDPEICFLKEPLTINALTYEQMKKAYCKVHKEDEISEIEAE